MSLKDLQEHGILLPKAEWGVHDLHTSVNEMELIACLAFGAVTLGMMYFGAGQTLTFVGMVLFIAFLGWITRVSVKGIELQAAQFAEEHEQFLEEHPEIEEDEAAHMFGDPDAEDEDE
ncbi:MAG: hypothetical protein ACOX9R_18540 [Armatimonadota bacterium]|jgi:hypothetical protein